MLLCERVVARMQLDPLMLMLWRHQPPQRLNMLSNLKACDGLRAIMHSKSTLLQKCYCLVEVLRHNFVFDARGAEWENKTRQEEQETDDCHTC